MVMETVKNIIQYSGKYFYRRLKKKSFKGTYWLKSIHTKGFCLYITFIFYIKMHWAVLKIALKLFLNTYEDYQD